MEVSENRGTPNHLKRIFHYCKFTIHRSTPTSFIAGGS